MNIMKQKAIETRTVVLDIGGHVVEKIMKKS